MVVLLVKVTPNTLSSKDSILFRSESLVHYSLQLLARHDTILFDSLVVLRLPKKLSSFEYSFVLYVQTRINKKNNQVDEILPYADSTALKLPNSPCAI